MAVWKRTFSLLALFTFLVLPSSTFAYEEDFHYYVIYLLLRCKGFDHSTSHQLAGFSQYVDDNRYTEPIFCWPKTRAKFHFINSNSGRATRPNDADARTALKAAFDEWTAGEPTAKYRVGWRLHLFADTFSHASFSAHWSARLNVREEWNIPMGHADTWEWGHAPDRPYNDPDVAIAAAGAIYDLIPAQSGAQIPWSQVMPELIATFGHSHQFRGRKIEERIEAMQKLIATRFSEDPVYDKQEFRKEREQFEYAVGQTR